MTTAEDPTNPPLADTHPADPIDLSISVDDSGQTIGPYTLRQLLGQGGMGAVYLAEQEHPVRRQVALKVVKGGMDSAQVVARFRTEMQALALMDHPNIARVLDAGATASGRPYFVMELVRGVPITLYCDQHRLTLRQRLELFIPICLAVQHAHQKGIIHRDLKPSNVLVTEADGQPWPKVIDFGLARATEPDRSEGEPFTQFGAVIGTLEYMSPEQAERSSQGIDTRTDIYSLGVLLYELLTGSPPLDWDPRQNTGLVEMLRLIRDSDPAPPSSKLLGSNLLPLIAAARQTDPVRLPRMLRGELDWIVLKALEKDRERRYDTAMSLAQDIRRYLADEPVEACPPSWGYRLRKFARRHRTLLAAPAACLLLLVAGLAVSIWQAVRAMAAEQRAVAARDRAHQAQEAAAAADFRRLTSQRQQLLANGILRATEVLVPVAAAFETWPKLSRRQFHSFVARILQQHPEIASVTWVPRIADTERAAVEQAARNDGLTAFAFRDFNPDGSYTGVLAADRAEHFPILYIEPLTSSNAGILGMDSSSSLARMPPLYQARDTGQMVASAPLLLGEEQAGRMGFLVFRPVYRGPTRTVAERRRSLLGFATAAFRIQDLVDRVLGDLAVNDVAITIYDEASGGPAIYHSPQVAVANGPQATYSLPVAGRRWQVEFTALASMPPNSP